MIRKGMTEIITAGITSAIPGAIPDAIPGAIPVSENASNILPVGLHMTAKIVSQMYRQHVLVTASGHLTTEKCLNGWKALLNKAHLLCKLVHKTSTTNTLVNIQGTMH